MDLGNTQTNEIFQLINNLKGEWIQFDYNYSNSDV